jgi:Skp family chaperone for outer membrane proteins
MASWCDELATWGCEVGLDWWRFRKQKGKLRMKRIAIVTLLLALGAGWPMPTEARDAGAPQSASQSDKAEQRKQQAVYAYQKKQEKAQEKAQRKADKQQQKAAKRYEKEQRKLLKSANLPVKNKLLVR